MRIIKLNATDSTNLFLRSLSLDTTLTDFTVVVAKHQTNGRGQMGTVWNTQDAKNLTFSVFKRFDGFNLNQQFAISMIVSLSVVSALNKLNIPKVRIKWPNDILSANSKICGILIENIIKQTDVAGSIIGIGLNVNQTDFKDLPQASSLQNITGKHFDLDEVLHLIIEQLQFYFEFFNQSGFDNLKALYQSQLFRKDKPSTFSNEEGLFTGIIKGVTKEGLLKVQIEDLIIKYFDLKAVKLLY
ncbi:biotin--[acetyl-CoA-carboxylase] ligase [Mesoflavibacter profundi]|uniref:Biotin--[acetyl-CoA-carboxylase] ligase n=1 Tax=Mesoflavibacter profundi TaxID=2708110 RepID=A0ABT4RZM4_9FLAO|nr:biotin--[acetyl-CoA-carboxylase] ligase [Mesoflavibacter profundi]MDA0177242.1 biotin--[acetyl-CoA-carboxylase] ligase [Mesoflavibacter profundi]